MSLLPTLSDPNLHRFITLFMIGLNAIVCNWAINQLAAFKTAHQGWRILKLAIEAAIFAIMADNWSLAIQGISSNDSAVQQVGVTYFVLISIVVGVLIDDFGRLIDRSSFFNIGAGGSSIRQNRAVVQLRRQRRALIHKVRLKWVRGVLEKSFLKTARIDLELGEHPKDNPDDPESFALERRRFPPGWRIFDTFIDLGEGGTLLILGEPGSGKTTQLLELARDLLDFTDAADLDQAVPVVLNLSSWGKVQGSDRRLVKTLYDWLIEELYTQYGIKREIGSVWLKQQDLTLLLDGLDEVPAGLREECVSAINQFQREHEITAMVVCSRIADYETLQSRLERFRKAVFVLPLEPQQVEHYLRETGQSLEGVRVALQRDTELRSLASKPLFLSILSLAYRGMSADELVNRPNSERLNRLFDRYLERMFANHPISKKNQQETQRFLDIVATQMGSGRTLTIDRMHPLEWLQHQQRQRIYRLIGGIIGGLIVGLMVGWLTGILFGLMFGLVFGLIFGLEK